MEQLQAILDTTRHMMWGKDQHISKLESELKIMNVKLSSISDHSEQLHGELEMLHEKSKTGIVPSQKQLKESEEVFLLYYSSIGA